jgi:Flp pilus assembly protein TadD
VGSKRAADAPARADLETSVAIAQLALGDPKSAHASVEAAKARAYGEALARQPIPVLAVWEYRALRNAGKSAEADAVADKWLRAHPKDPTLEIVIVEQAKLDKNYPSAVTHYRTALALKPNDLVLLNNLASVLAEMSDPKAVDYAERAYLQAPYNPACSTPSAGRCRRRATLKRVRDCLSRHRIWHRPAMRHGCTWRKRY